MYSHKGHVMNMILYPKGNKNNTEFYAWWMT